MPKNGKLVSLVSQRVKTETKVQQVGRVFTPLLRFVELARAGRSTTVIKEILPLTLLAK